MPFSARTRVEIRDSLLADLAARYAAVNRVIDVSKDSDAWMRAEAFAALLERFDAQAVQLDKEILPDKATYTLPRHGAVEGVPRDPAIKSILTATITGTPSATVTFGSTTGNASDGTTFTSSANADGTGSSIALDGSGNADIFLTCQTAGTIGNKSIGSIFTWSSTPTNANANLTITGTERLGVNEESDSSYAARIIQRLQERPASGNRSDWVAWATDVDGVDDALVYPLLHPDYGPETPGAVTIVALGPAQGRSGTNTRYLSPDQLDLIRGYIEGENDASGNTSGTLKQLRPVTMAPGDYSIERPDNYGHNVEFQVVLAAAYEPQWTYDASYLVLASPLPTDSTFSVAGDLTSIIGTSRKILVPTNTDLIRGGYALVQPTSATFSGGNTDFVIPTLPDSVASGMPILPPPVNWAEIQDAVFALFDSLGPSDITPAARWPTEEMRLRSTLRKSAIEAAVVQIVDARGTLLSGVRGVLGATVSNPSSDYTPPAKGLATLAYLIVHV